MNDPRPGGRGDALLVVCLCAAWCYVCNDFRPTLAALAQKHPDLDFVWLDIEDDGALVGNVDIDDFPTFALFRGDTPVFFGVTRARAPAVSRTLEFLLGPAPSPVAVPEQIAALPQALRGRRREARA